MIALLWFVLAILASPLKAKSRLAAKNATLRHQLVVLRRMVHGRIRLTNNDRLFFIQTFPRSRRVYASAPEAPVKVGQLRSPAERVALTGAVSGTRELGLR